MVVYILIDDSHTSKLPEQHPLVSFWVFSSSSSMLQIRIGGCPCTTSPAGGAQQGCQAASRSQASPICLSYESCDSSCRPAIKNMLTKLKRSCCFYGKPELKVFVSVSCYADIQPPVTTPLFLEGWCDLPILLYFLSFFPFCLLMLPFFYEHRFQCSCCGQERVQWRHRTRWFLFVSPFSYCLHLCSLTFYLSTSTKCASRLS